ncbi:cytochrome P450 [Corallococcus terminator]|uniref:cytochrome P450 n=1 Tax=Corallococcus terminator TaxID=2316733 RepID=UPI0013158A1A|nr:cytochrome P450 [Corallococcus terminator]
MTNRPQAPELGLMTREGAVRAADIYQRIREAAPVSWSPTFMGWLIMGHAEVTSAFRHPQLSSERVDATLEPQLRRAAPGTTDHLLRFTRRFITMKDGTAHATTRRWASRGFGPQRLASWRPVVERTTHDLLDAVATRGELDVVKDFADPFPGRVITALFGVAPADQAMFHECSERIASFFGGALHQMEAAAPRANAAIARLDAYFRGRLAQERHQPGEDLLGLWIAGHEGAELDEEDIVAQCIATLVGGNITTTDQLAIGARVFLEHPEQLRLLREQPELARPAAEELVRFEGSVPFMHRIVKEDFEFGGKPFKKGQTAFLGITSGNHDPRVFEAPERFDILRKPGPNLGYGTGRHTCLGIHLARLELEVALQTLFQRLPGLRLDERRPPRVKFNLLTRGLESLMVRF